MGGQVSTARNQDSEINIDNIVNETNNELGELDLFEQIGFNAAGDNVNTVQKIYITSLELGDLFEKAYAISMKNLDKHIKLNNLQFNYKEKNKVIIQDLKNKIRIQAEELKEAKEGNFKNIRETKDIINKTRDEDNSRKYFIIILVILILINLGIIGLFAKRKMDSGKFTLTKEF